MSWFKEAVSHKKEFLAGLVADPLSRLAADCSAVWPDARRLDHCLVEGQRHLPSSSLLYALDAEGLQLSANVGPSGIDPGLRGQNLTNRPYLQGALPYQGFMLSNAYISRCSHEPCISAVHAVRRGVELLGFVIADFELQALDLEAVQAPQQEKWGQYKGDPAIRSALFSQQRSQSLVDERIDEVLRQVEKMLTQHGVFHVKLHFSGARATFWEHKDPYNYRLHSIDQLLDPELLLLYPRCSYPENALVGEAQVAAALNYMKELRYADDVIYLRSGSINLVNGMIGLNFSCDGSHYMTAEEFLNKDLAFWFGATEQLA